MTESYKRFPFQYDIPPTASSQQVDQIYITSGSVNARDVVYIPASGGLQQASNSALTTARAIGLSLSTAGTSTPVTVRRHGRVSGFSGLTTGSDYFLDSVAGGITSVVPTASGSYVVLIGRAASATQLDLQIAMVAARA